MRRRPRQNGIDLSILTDLTDQDLKDIGVLLGRRRLLLRAILGPSWWRKAGVAATKAVCSGYRPNGPWAALFDCQRRDGCVDLFAYRANDLDTIVLAEFFADRRVSQISLPVHEACNRIPEFGGHAHNRPCIVAGAVPKIGRDRH
jgi:hypothetical protein